MKNIWVSFSSAVILSGAIALSFSAPKPAIAGDYKNTDTAMWEHIRTSNNVTLIRQFLFQFPGTEHEVEALMLLTSLLSESELKETKDEEPVQDVTFAEALSGFGDEIDGKSIQALIESQPLFSPIEGLPDEVWKNQDCANCHQWTAPTLCTQANHYTKAENAGRLELQHPLGRPFKRALKVWAEGGCN